MFFLKNKRDYLKKRASEKGVDSDDPILYTMGNDTRLPSLALLLESNRIKDNFSVNVIPFDENIEHTKLLCEIYGAKVIEPNGIYDDLGKTIFRNEFYRPGVESWRFFRKLNVFNGSISDFIFLDSNVVIMNSLKPVLRYLKPKRILFAARSRENRNFPPWSKQLLNLANPNIKDGFNAGFWCSNSALFTSDIFESLKNKPDLRKFLGKAPEQSFLNMIAALSDVEVSLYSDFNDSINAIVFAERLGRSVKKYGDGRFTWKNKEVISIKWTGSYFSSGGTMPNVELVNDVLSSMLHYVDNNNAFVANAIRLRFKGLIDLGEK